jgi:hypothetical protein
MDEVFALNRVALTLGGMLLTACVSTAASRPPLVVALHLLSDDGQTQHLVVTLEQRIRSSPHYRLALAEDRPDVIVTIHNSASTMGYRGANRMAYEVVFNTPGNAEARRRSGRCPAGRPIECASKIVAAVERVLRSARRG